MDNMRSIKVNIIEREDDGTYTVHVTVDDALFEYKSKEEISEMIIKEIYNSIPLNNVKCRFYKWHGQCAIQKNCPQCMYYGDARKCKILSGNVKLKGV